MAELLLLGMTHYPPLAAVDEDMAGLMRMILADPGIPAEAKDPAAWPEPMRPSGATTRRGRRRPRTGPRCGPGSSRSARRARGVRPGRLVVWGDDQYENFREDLIPPYALLAYDDVEAAALGALRMAAQRVGRGPSDHAHKVRGRPDVGPLAGGEAARRRHRRRLRLPAAAPRRAWPMPSSTRCCSSTTTASASRGRWCACRSTATAAGHRRPRRSADRTAAGRARPAVAVAAPADGRRRRRGPPPAASPWRVALVASSSWSHAFLTDHTWRLRPDTAADRALYDALVAGDFEPGRTTTARDRTRRPTGGPELVRPARRGAGARARQPGVETFVETWCFNSNKVFACVADAVSVNGRLAGKVAIVTGTSPNIGGDDRVGLRRSRARRWPATTSAPRWPRTERRDPGRRGRSASPCPATSPTRGGRQPASRRSSTRWGAHRRAGQQRGALQHEGRARHAGRRVPPSGRRRSLGGAFLMTQAVARSMVERDVARLDRQHPVDRRLAGPGRQHRLLHGEVGADQLHPLGGHGAGPARHPRATGSRPRPRCPTTRSWPQRFRRAAAGGRPAGRWTSPVSSRWAGSRRRADYVPALVFLASDDSAMMTGTNLTVDGGALAKYWPQRRPAPRNRGRRMTQPASPTDPLSPDVTSNRRRTPSQAPKTIVPLGRRRRGRRRAVRHR